MASSAIRRVDIAAESTYMQRSASTGEPTTTGLMWEPCELSNATAVTAIGTTQTLQTNTSTGGFGVNPGEALLNGATGDPIKTGTLTIEFYLRGGVTANTGLRRMLSSRMLTTERAAVAAEATIDSDGDLSITGATLAAGQFVGYTGADGRVTYGVMGSTTSPIPTQTDYVGSGRRGIGYASGGTQKIIEYKQPNSGGDPIAYGSGTFALRVTGDGWQQICYGCSLTALTISADGDGRAVKCSATVDCPYVVDQDTVTTPSYPTVTEGPVLHALGSPVNLGGYGGDDAPFLDSWSVALTWTTAGSACGSYWSGRAPLEATSLDVAVNMTIAGHDVETYRAHLLDKWESGTTFPLLLPFGGDLSSAATPRQWGGAIILPAAYVTSGDVGIYDLSSETIKCTATIGAAQPTNASLPIIMLGVF